MQLLRTILIIILVYYLFRLFARYVMPILARYFIRKSMKAHQRQQESNRRKPGDIRVEFSPEKNNPTDQLGEYVEYEEINEDQKEPS